MRLTFILSACALAGCATTGRGCGDGSAIVKVPVPVECREETPTRPAMPTETLTGTEPLDVQNRAMRGEIDRREGYEIELRTALENCKRPLTPPS